MTSNDNAALSPYMREAANTIALVRASKYGLTDVKDIYLKAGSATAVLDHCLDIRRIVPEATDRQVNAVEYMPAFLGRAATECEYDLKKGIIPITYNDARYPSRLRQCADAPLVLFYRGNADLNARRVVSIVGTRHSTPYGHDTTARLVADLKALCPQMLIVSGLAYGIDICAHTAALDNGMLTVGVLAHGLDNLYPVRHKPTAERMKSQGGLLTEFTTLTNADKLNFVRRNRIVAGMADATIIVESAAQGGGLITTRMAADYGRPVFAVPGPVSSPYSEGCNNLIRSHGATLITSARDLLESMHWLDGCRMEQARRDGIERQLFPSLSPQEQAVVDLLAQDNDLKTDVMAARLGMPVPTLTPLLFSLEMKGVVRLYAGGTYHLIS